jgi:hypothetical protein
MKNVTAILFFIGAAMASVVFIGKKFRISTRYERKPRELSAWNSLDKGIDPTKAKKK